MPSGCVRQQGRGSCRTRDVEPQLDDAAPTREAADALLAAPFPADANDVLYHWEPSRNYNPSPGLERIEAAVLAINSADDERNPPETGIMERTLSRIRTARLLLIPASDSTRGHQTDGFCPLLERALRGVAGNDTAQELARILGDAAMRRRADEARATLPTYGFVSKAGPIILCASHRRRGRH